MAPKKTLGRHMKRWPTSLASTEMQIAISTTHHLMHLAWPSSARWERASIDEDVGTQEHLFVAGGNAKWRDHRGKQSAVPWRVNQNYHMPCHTHS